ncbi:hypothetical protein BHE74_00033692, partial [Ensete ventricosum]
HRAELVAHFNHLWTYPFYTEEKVLMLHGAEFRSRLGMAMNTPSSHKERLSTVETRLDILEASLEELYQGQGRLLGVESSQEEAKSRIDKVESLVDRLTKDTKDSV